MISGCMGITSQSVTYENGVGSIFIQRSVGLICNREFGENLTTFKGEGFFKVYLFGGYRPNRSTYHNGQI